MKLENFVTLWEYGQFCLPITIITMTSKICIAPHTEWTGVLDNESNASINLTRTAMLGCQIQKCTIHVYSPGVTTAASSAKCISQFTDEKSIISS